MANAYKNALRKSMLSVRNRLDKGFIDDASAAVYDNIKKLKPYRKARRIALYQAVGGEIHLQKLWNAAPLQGKYCYFPCINEDNTLTFLPATPKTPFQANRFGIQEPQTEASQAVEPEKLDLIFMPLVAFDRYGHRLGMGAGYYDRTLSERRHGLLVGVAHEFQAQDFITPDPWDIPLDVIITEKNIYWSQPCPAIG